MKKGFLDFNWNNTDEFSSEEISYYLFLEGKSINAIAKIRKLEREEIQSHIISGKIKFGILSKAKNEEELFNYLCTVAKEERIRVLDSMDNILKEKLMHYIIERYNHMDWKQKEKSIWLIGEAKYEGAISILLKASVHKNINLRRLSVSALGKFENLKGESALIRALEDENSQVIQYAIKSLERIKSNRGVEKVKKILNSTDKKYLKEACENYLESIEEVRGRK
ncbi:HEAT repeat domain-containing protein [Hathewaya massiliensis]|uniref:HEAT repeat domain-containing protein n=1 Tax=Hathewaya massiliensis TaxID=1964382 RepID=UPI00115C395E|nr:HEAT repeat domain-containing protein [Hathewaya massiliensis]